ncbi:alpha/beta fold hydrolase [Marinobacteraceae bacterium S3BR75-40.1]
MSHLSSDLLQRTRQAVSNAGRLRRKPQSLIQSGDTPYDVIFQEGIVSLRYYPPLDTDSIEVEGESVAVASHTYRTPILLVPPLAVTLALYDLFPDRSLVKYLRARGFEVYLIDWGEPGWQQNHFDLAHYFADWVPQLIKRVREHSGERKLTLHGWSFGGLFSYCAAALGDPDIANLVLVGAPCDYHANGRLGRYYQRLSRVLTGAENLMGFRIHDTRKRWWRSPGWANSLAFKLTNPVAHVQNFGALVRNLHDEDYVSNHATLNAFINGMLAYPGGVIQDTLAYLLKENVLARGQLPMEGGEGSLGRIRASVLLTCGRSDEIVTEDCAKALLDQVSSSDTKVLRVPGGHMGILSGSKAPAQIWPEWVEWLSERS